MTEATEMPGPFTIASAIASALWQVYRTINAKSRALSAWIFAERLDQDVAQTEKAESLQETEDALRKTENDILGDLRS